ncbi:hypothetical protein BFW01_g5035 [Lasiodiplodia theobromae]|nr:hypothetical protein BFW01_g5035 [Lasiodiplodia theobromae]
MAGIETIGIVASVSQLVQYSAKLIRILQDICQNAAQSKKRYRRHEQQVQQVIQIAELIRTTDGLQSALILSHLESLTETTKSIEEAIEKALSIAGPEKKLKKCLKILNVSKADSAIHRGFDELERDKSCLTLCLLGSFGSLIVSGRSSVKQVPGQLESMQKSLQDCPKVAEESKKIKENAPVSRRHRLCSSCECDQANMQGSTRPDV